MVWQLRFSSFTALGPDTIPGCELRSHELLLVAKYEKNKGFPGGSVVKNPPINAGDTGSIPGSGRTHVPWSYRASVPQPLSLCPGAQKWQPLSPTLQLLKTVRPRAQALQQEKPRQWEASRPQLESSPQSPQLEKSPRCNEDPVQPKINKCKNKNKLSRPFPFPPW